MDRITNPHDKLFRETLSDREVAADFLQNYKAHGGRIAFTGKRRIGYDDCRNDEKRRIQQGIQQSIRETIEFGFSFRFGDEGLAIMPLIRHIQDYERLRVIRDAIKTVKDLSDLKDIIGN